MNLLINDIVMNLYLLYVVLLACEVSRSSYGQTIPETNNKNHYDDSTARKEIALLYRKLKAGYSFDKLAQAYSQDYGTYTIGGKLGWQKPAQFIPGFAKVVGQLSKAEFSEPFKTDFGYHIVQLLEKQEGEVLTRHILLRVNR